MGRRPGQSRILNESESEEVEIGEEILAVPESPISYNSDEKLSAATEEAEPLTLSYKSPWLYIYSYTNQLCILLALALCIRDCFIGREKQNGKSNTVQGVQIRG